MNTSEAVTERTKSECAPPAPSEQGQAQFVVV